MLEDLGKELDCRNIPLRRSMSKDDSCGEIVDWQGSSVSSERMY